MVRNRGSQTDVAGGGCCEARARMSRPIGLYNSRLKVVVFRLYLRCCTSNPARGIMTRAAKATTGTRCAPEDTIRSSSCLTHHHPTFLPFHLFWKLSLLSRWFSVELINVDVSRGYLFKMRTAMEVTGYGTCEGLILVDEMLVPSSD